MRITISMSSSASLASVAMCWCGFRISTRGPAWMSAAVISRGPRAWMRAVSSVPPSCSLTRTSFRLRTMSVTSSVTPGTVENSCSTLFTRAATIAAPCSEESSTRRSALPIVVPYPRSNGSPKNLPYVGVRLFSSTSSRRGLISSRQLLWTIASGVCVERSCNSMTAFPCPRALLGVELHDQLLVDRHGEIGTGRERLHDPRERGGVDREPLRDTTALRQLERLLDARHLTAPLPDAHRVARADQVG